jgi:serine/threonine protein kinase
MAFEGLRVSNPMTLERGTLLNNRYRIVEILGQGGMASIYRAVDENLGVEVAVKENMFTTEEYARQFRREAVILASLRHPNLPRVTDHFVIEKQGQYLVMDYIEGEDLRQRMDRIGVISEEEVITIGVAICDALTYLHSRTPSVLHRDVKPGNVKITRIGQIFLVDFGLAKIVQNGKATTTGARAMTPGYSPPEQYGTARTDHRTDIYALGATLYSALTDALPEDGLARAMEQCGLTPIRQHNPKISRRLSSVIEKALEVRPEDRYQSAEEFKRDMLKARTGTKRRNTGELILPPAEGEEGQNPFLSEVQVDSIPLENPAFYDSEPQPISISRPISEPAVSPPPRRRKRRNNAWAIFLLFLVIFGGGGGGWVYLTKPGWLNSVPLISALVLPSVTPTSTENTIPETLPAAAMPSSTSTVSPSPTVSPTVTLTPTRTRVPPTTIPPTPTALGSGTGQIAFASDRNGGIPQIWLKNTDGSDPIQITTLPEGACQPDWSPDGKRLVFISPCTKNQESYPGSSMYIINADGTELKPLLSVPGGDYDPVWSPNGYKIAFTSLRDDGAPKVCVIDLRDNTVQVLAAEGSKDMQPAWSPDGRRIVFVSNRNGPQQIWTMFADGSTETRFSISGSLKNSNPAWSPDGNVIIFTQAEEDIGIPWLVVAAVNSEDTRGVRLYSADVSFPLREAKYSPDGVWIVFEGWGVPENHDIYYMFATGSNLTALTNDPASDFDPAWRPSGPSQ